MGDNVTEATKDSYPAPLTFDEIIALCERGGKRSEIKAMRFTGHVTEDEAEYLFDEVERILKEAR